MGVLSIYMGEMRVGTLSPSIGRQKARVYSPARAQRKPSAGSAVSAKKRPRTVVVSARAASGPVAVSVASVEFARDATTLVMIIENAAESPVELFMAIADAQLMDNTGKTYAVRVVRSDLPDRIEARSQARGRLVFEPMPHPPAVTSARLTLPGIRAGGVLHDVDVHLWF